MFYPDVSDEAVQFEGEAEDVVLVAAVSHHKAPVRFPRQNPLRCLPRKRSPVPAALRKKYFERIENLSVSTHVFHFLNTGREVHEIISLLMFLDRV